MTELPLTVASLEESARDLRSFARVVHSVADSVAEASPLTSALSLVGRCIEMLSDKIAALDPATAHPDAFTADDMTILILLAGYTSGPSGIATAFSRIKEIHDDERNTGGRRV